VALVGAPGAVGSSPGLDMPIWRIPESRDWGVHPDMLFAPDDPGQEHDVASEHPEQVKRLEEILRQHLRERLVPAEP
jgi:hypothetical protein